MAERKNLTIGGIVWRIVMVIVAIWLVIFMLRISGVNIFQIGDRLFSES